MTQFSKPTMRKPDPPGLTEDERELLSDLYDTWSGKLARNRRRMSYYNQRQRMRNIGVAIPPSVAARLEPVVGWPAKAVDALAARSRFEGFVSPEGPVPELDAVMARNRFGQMYNKAKHSELIHSCAFLTVTRGGEDEPGAVVNAYSAETASALWDIRGKRILAGLCIVDCDRRTGEATQMNMHTSDSVIEIRASGGGWEAERHGHGHGRPLMVPMVYKPELDRPFGRSRISRAVMAITDMAMRTVARTELAAEFFTSPQKYLLGADDDVFDAPGKSKIESYLGSIFSVTPNENGDIPHFGQLAQASMQPHIDCLRSLASMFAGETYIPVSYLGVIHDNPASADAMHQASEELIIAAEDMNDENGAALADVATLALAIARNKTVSELSDAERAVAPVFASPVRASLPARADFMTKTVAVAPWIGGTRVALEYLGFSDSEITRLMADKKAAEAAQAIAALISTGGGGDAG